MKHYSRLILPTVCTILLMGCGKLDYKKTRSGLLYKIITTKDSKGPVAKMGNILKLFYQQKLNDSLLQSNYGKMPAYQPIDASLANNDYSPTEIFGELHSGDSAITVLFVDSLVLKGKMTTMPPFMKRGDRIVLTFKVVDLFTSDSQARLDNTKTATVIQSQEQKEMAGESIKEKKDIEDYLAAHKINAQQTPKGAFVQVLDPGTGLQADSGKFVSMKYRGTTFEGKTFDTNMDSSFHHMQPLQFVVGTNSMIAGFDEGCRLLKKGGKANVYVPAVIGYGPNPVMPGGKAFENLIFNIEVLDVKDAPAPGPKFAFPKKNDTTHRKK